MVLTLSPPHSPPPQPPSKKIKSALSAGRTKATVYWMRNVLFLLIFCLEGKHWTLTAIQKQREVSLPAFVEFLPQAKSEVLLLHDAWPLTRVHTMKLSQNLDGPCHHIQPKVLTSHYQMFTCLFLWKTACEGTMTQMRHCTSCASVCRKEGGTFVRQEHMLLFKGKRKLLTKMKTAVKNKSAFQQNCSTISWNFHMSTL
jgi:hypothetical protein